MTLTSSATRNLALQFALRRQIISLHKLDCNFGLRVLSLFHGTYFLGIIL
jgi:hypothetical protein